MIAAINSVNRPGELAVTTLAAQDRGGASLFISGAVSFEGAVDNFALPAISDLAGNPLEPNRDDDTTQFTYLLPSIGLDYGDAADPVSGIAGRYPTSLANDGARHIVGGDLFLGSSVDTNADGLPTANADGDDSTLIISETGDLFTISITGGVATVLVNAGSVDPLTRDGDTIVIDTGVAQAILEFDTNGRFDEDHFAISPVDPSSAASITEAITNAIAESPVNPASVSRTTATVTISADDEDGVQFTGTNGNVINAGIATTIEVTVTGSGVLEGWIDFNADGDWTDPGEQIIPIDQSSPFAARRDELCPIDLTGTTSNNFGGSTGSTTRTFCIIVPPTTTAPVANVDTYARFRVSAEGGLSPTGLALSGEVEDYALQLTNGLPPTVSEAQANRDFNTNEDTPLIVSPANGLLVGVVDPDGDSVSISPSDVTPSGMPRDIFTVGGTLAGQLNLSSDGGFDFTPEATFNGVVQFTASVTDGTLVSPRPITVTINVDPVNNAPTRGPGFQIVSRTIAEDTVQSFDSDELIVGVGSAAGALFVAGPANESDQGLIFQSVGSIRGANISEQGGTLAIVDGGTRIEYTPPADFNGSPSDTFNYIVVDVPTDGTPAASASAANDGTVSIDITAVNDAPRAGNDNFTGVEDIPTTIPIADILVNDFAGPSNEVAAPENQTVSLVTSIFPITTQAGGSVTLEGDNLVYRPPGLFSGIDRFDYQIEDNLGLVGTATVAINLSNVNNNPIFLGVNGATVTVGDEEEPVTTIQVDESKTQALSETYDLTTWFRDPELANLTFTVASDNPSVAAASLGTEANDSNVLTIVYPSFAFGTANLTVTATDPEGAQTSQVVLVTVNNTPDPPSRIGTLDPLNGTEDQVVTADLRTIFDDPDNEPLTYTVLRLGDIFNPSAAQIAAHPLVESIEFVGDEMRITLKADQSQPSVNIEIAASDGSSQVSDSFVLNVTSVPDAPVAGNDSYFVPIGARLDIVNPTSGLLRNDSDADGDAITVRLETIAGDAAANLVANADGTFSYQSPTGGSVGDQASITYRIVDSTGESSNQATVTFTLNQSRFQNPLADLREDVTADGNITGLDALRVINFLSRRAPGTTTPGTVLVSEINEPPPNFYDVNGNGEITALDALLVVNKLQRLNNSFGGESEFVPPISSAASSAITSSIVAPVTSGLPSRQLEVVSDEATTITADQSSDPLMATDQLLASGLSIDSAASDSATQWYDGSDDRATSVEEHDEALASIFDDDSRLE